MLKDASDNEDSEVKKKAGLDLIKLFHEILEWKIVTSKQALYIM